MHTYVHMFVFYLVSFSGIANQKNFSNVCCVQSNIHFFYSKHSKTNDFSKYPFKFTKIEITNIKCQDAAERFSS